MGNTGLFFPILVFMCITISLGVSLLERWLNPSDTETYEKWLEKELRKNPDYINWLEHSNGGKDYKLGLRILREIKKGCEKK